MTHAIHRPPAMTMKMKMTNTHTKTETKTEKFQEKWVNEYRFKYPVLMIIGWDVLAHDNHCQLQNEDKDKYKYKDKDKDNSQKTQHVLYLWKA